MLSLKKILKERTSLIKEDETQDQLKRILKKDYEAFVRDLGNNITDPKFLNAVKSLASKAPVRTTNISPICTKLKPTQKEVVMNKSLSYPLKDSSLCEIFLKGGVITVNKRPIVTGGNGKFIIDGHHRWSQLYCINPDAKIKALDLMDIRNPFEALKATQIGIGAELGEIPTAEGGGVNLFTVTEDVLTKYVIERIQDRVVDVFAKYNKGGTPEEIASYIWGNVQKMQKENEPVTNAPERQLMPQTDDAPNWKDKATNTEKLPESVGIKLKDLLA